jgi:uncharacterized protein YuzE
MSPVYIRLSDKKWFRTLDINNRGLVYIDLSEDGEIIGVEVLNNNYKIEIDGKTHEQN